MPNAALVDRIIERLKPYVSDAESPGGLEMIESNLRLLDQMLGDQGGAHLGEMLAAVERAISGLESGNTDAALAEADAWGVGHLVRAQLDKGGKPVDLAPLGGTDAPVPFGAV